MRTKSQTLDIVGFASSLICAVHCAAIPLLLSFSSLSALHFLGNPWIEWSFIGLGVVFAGTSIIPGYRKLHLNPRPLIIVGLGFTFIILGRLDLTEWWEVLNTVAGAILVSFSHLVNWKLTRGYVNHSCSKS